MYQDFFIPHMSKILVIDNYDSFTFNLVHYLEAIGGEITVMRNDEIDFDIVSSFSKILLSPGPGIPDEAGQLKKLIQDFATTKSILGVCLGHQAIAEVFGATLGNLEQVYHGIATSIEILDPQEILFKNIPNTIEVGRYHSWVVSKNQFPNDLEITALDNHNQIMALRHKFLDVRGVQFHPESILTAFGKDILHNWMVQKQKSL